MKIKFLRQQLGKSQEQVAKELNIPRTKFARIEIGESKPSISDLTLIADYFEVSLDYLCGRPFKNQIELEPYQREIYNLLPTLKKEQCSAILSMINAFNVPTTQEDLLTAQLIKKYGDK